MDPTLPQHDETIVPTRPGFRARSEPGEPRAAAAPSAPAKQAKPWVALAGGAVLVVGVLAAFVWVPSRVEEERVVAATAPAPDPVVVPARPVLSAEEQARLKQEAEALLAGLLTLEERLTSLSVEQWANDDWQRYQALSEEGDNALLDDDVATAARAYGDATALGNALIERAAAAVERSFDAGEAALAAGNAELAIEQYDLVLTIDPAHEAARTQRARAEQLPAVLELVRRADSERAGGELEAALASYREALALDPAWQPAAAGIDDVTRAIRDAEFERLLSDAFTLLGNASHVEAQERFRAALALRPNSREAKDGLVQAEEGAKLDEIALTEARALAFERRELWDQAIVLYRSTLESDETLLFAQTGLERALARAGLDAKLQNLIDNPALLLTDSVLADARRLLGDAAAETARGPRLDGQVAELERLIALASKPISVRLTSDELTTVTLYRVGTLGAFAARDVELRPGTYTVVGSRDGYRDVRQTFTVRPGASLPPINVVCVERI